MDTAYTAALMLQPDDLAKACECKALYFEDMVPGEFLISPTHKIDKNELLTFAKIWDPLPIHIDEASGIKAFGSITAPGLYMLAIKQRLIHLMPPLKVFASTGYDDVRFHAPLRPNDKVVLRLDWISRRLSSSKPHLGIVNLRFSLLNQDGVLVLSHLDTILVERNQEIEVHGGS